MADTLPTQMTCIDKHSNLIWNTIEDTPPKHVICYNSIVCTLSIYYIMPVLWLSLWTNFVNIFFLTNFALALHFRLFSLIFASIIPTLFVFSLSLHLYNLWYLSQANPVISSHFITELQLI